MDVVKQVIAVMGLENREQEDRANKTKKTLVTVRSNYCKCVYIYIYIYIYINCCLFPGSVFEFQILDSLPSVLITTLISQKIKDKSWNFCLLSTPL